MCEELCNSEQIGRKIYEQEKERLQPASTVGVFDPIKKVKLKTFRSCNAKVKLKDRTIQLSEDSNLWRKWTIISSSRDMDGDTIMGNFELTITPQSLMPRDKTLYSGYTGKSELMTVIKDAIGTESKFENPKVECVAIDGMCMLHRHKLPTNTKTGNDLIAAVCSWVDKLTVGCSTVIVAFDTYLDMSFKRNTRNDRYGKSDTKKEANRHYIITPTTNISRLSMIQLLSHSKTKHSIVELLLFPLRNHLRSRSKLCSCRQP